jgi:hypothetical protein
MIYTDAMGITETGHAAKYGVVPDARRRIVAIDPVSPSPGISAVDVISSDGRVAIGEVIYPMGVASISAVDIVALDERRGPTIVIYSMGVAEVSTSDFPVITDPGIGAALIAVYPVGFGGTGAGVDAVVGDRR